jgi:hypothetical protein
LISILSPKIGKKRNGAPALSLDAKERENVFRDAFWPNWQKHAAALGAGCASIAMSSL